MTKPLGGDAPLATRDKVCAAILAHVEKHGRPPMLKQVAFAIDKSIGAVAYATQRLIEEGRLDPRLRSTRAHRPVRERQLRDLCAAGLSKTAIAQRYSLHVRTVFRALEARA